MADRRVEYLPLDDVLAAADPQNPKNHDLDLIDSSVTRHGIVDIITRDDRTGLLISGHGRATTLGQQRDRGAEPPDGVTVLEDGSWTVPVNVGWSSKNDDEARAALLLMNRATELGGWVDDALLTALDALTAADITLEDVGFDQAELDALRASLDQGDPTRRDPDAVPPPPEADPISQKGDLWTLGRHSLVVGDCTNADVVTKVGAARADLILTDPPYSSGGWTEAGKAGGAGSVGTEAEHKPIANDRLSVRGYQALLKAALDAVPAPFAYVFTDWRMWTYLFDVMETSGRNVRSMVVWDKGTPGMGAGWRTQHEIVMWGAAETAPFDLKKGRGNVLQSQRTGNILHTTQKPVDLLTQILQTTDFARIVYDPFAGSGTTLIACEENDRTALLVELDPSYADVICRRFQQHTGTVPTRDGTPHDFLTD